VHIVTEYVVSYGTCDGVSMLPTINSFGDAVLISKYYRRGRGVKVGDIISYTHPIIPEMKALKRVVGMEGDFVMRDTPGTGLDESEEKMLQVC
jgi:inner membrane protease subunit 1